MLAKSGKVLACRKYLVQASSMIIEGFYERRVAGCVDIYLLGLAMMPSEAWQRVTFHNVSPRLPGLRFDRVPDCIAELAENGRQVDNVAIA